MGAGRGGEGGRSREAVTHPPVPAIPIPRLGSAALPSAGSRLFSGGAIRTGAAVPSLHGGTGLRCPSVPSARG